MSAYRDGGYDVAIVGGGVNGLAAANVLARHGLRVVLFEQNPWPGGLAGHVPGVAPSLYAYAYGLVPREVEALLGLRGRLRLHRPDPSWVALDRYGAVTFEWWRDAQRLETEAVERGLEGLPHLVRLAVRFVSCLKKGGGYYTVSPPSRDEAAGIVDRCDPEAAVFAERTGSAILSEYLPRSAWDLVAYPSMLSSNGYSLAYYLQNWNVWDQPLPGMGAVGEALLESAVSLGVEARMGARVARIIVENGRASGVVLSGGSRVRVRAVLLSVPLPLIPRLAGEDLFSEHDLRAIRRVASRRLDLYRVDYILRARPSPPRGRGWEGTPIYVFWSHGRGGEYTYPCLTSGGSVCIVQASGRPGVGPSEPPPPGSCWDDIVLANVRGPGSQEACCGNPNGHPDHVPMADPHLYNRRPLDGWGDYRVPGVEGLYHGSSSSYPGGEVNLVSGINAALRVMLDHGMESNVKEVLGFLGKEAGV